MVMLQLLLLAPVGVQIGYVENAVRIGAGIDAFCGKRLDVAQDAVLERDGVVERVELVVVVVYRIRVREVDGKDSNPLGSCV